MTSRLITLFTAATLWLSGQSLKKVASLDLPGPKGQRFDYLTTDDEDHYLLSAHLGPGILYVIDMRTQRLFVAALGNNTIEVIDIAAAKRILTIPGLGEPQGLLYVPTVDRLYAVNRADGTLRIFDAASWKPLQTIELEALTPTTFVTTRPASMSMSATAPPGTANPA